MLTNSMMDKHWKGRPLKVKPDRVPDRIAKSYASHSDRCFWGCSQQGHKIRKDAKLALLQCLIPGLFPYQQNWPPTYLLLPSVQLPGPGKKPAVLFAEVKSILRTIMINEKMTSTTTPIPNFLRCEPCGGPVLLQPCT